MFKKFNLKTLNLKKKRKRYIDLILKIDPESKRSMGKKQVEIQKKIINQMKKKRFKKIRSTISVEIIVNTSNQNPPRIEKFVKNLLDLMHKEEILEDINDTEFLPFEEDRNVKYLSVRYMFLPKESSVFVRIRPFSSFISDLHFIDTEIKTDESDNEDFMSIKNHYEELILNKKQYIKSFSLKAYEAMLDLATLDMQKSLTSNMGISPFVTKLIYPKKGTKPDFIKDTYREWAKQLINFPIRIKLPEIPTEKNTSQKYKVEIKSQLSSYLEERTIFKTLKAPVVVTVFYSPPVKKKGFYKDIDNIMLEYILPIFNEIFTPPLSLLNLHMNERKEGLSRFTDALPKSLNGSAMGYEIIELPKKYSESEKGFLSVGFRIVDLEDSMIQWIDEKIESYIENNKYVYA